MHDFELHAPDSIHEAVEILAEHGGSTRVLAGGTALTTMVKQSLVRPDHIVSLHRVPGWSHVARLGPEINIGMLATHRAIETSPLIREHAPLLADTYAQVATVRIRSMATVGGGIAHGDPAQDPLPTLLALNARVRLLSATGERQVPVGDLFRDFFDTDIGPDELLIEVQVPAQPHDLEGVYLKFLPRSEDDYATVGVAALARVERGRFQEARVALGAVGPVPLRATAVEQALQGRKADAATVRKAAELVGDLVDPVDDARGSADYKRDMAVVFTRRALEQVAGIPR
ncbi:MAG: xanthine dehydrogenase family protein subunit M [SAR202 cluster bacterium]|nr:xanthine dehydrogenase family protein subunit M [SAR202 cluster bacterium]